MVDDKPQLKTGVYAVKASGENETRELHLAKLTDGSYQIQIWWGKGQRALATMRFGQQQWDRLASFTEGLKRK